MSTSDYGYIGQSGNTGHFNRRPSFLPSPLDNMPPQSVGPDPNSDPSEDPLRPSWHTVDASDFYTCKRCGRDVRTTTPCPGEPEMTTPEPDPDILEAVITNEALRAAHGERIVLASVIRRAITDYLALTTGGTQP